MTLSEAINDPNWITFVSGLLSVTGSFLILRFVVSRGHLKHLYNRVMLGIAVTDLIYSIHLSIFSVTIRTENRQPGPACSYEGFIHTFLVLPSIFYNGLLSLYFLLTIRYNQRDRIAKLEPYAHVFCILIPLICGIVGLAMQSYGPGNPDVYSCWYIFPNDPPLICDENGNGCYNPYSKSAEITAVVLTWFQVGAGAVVFTLLVVDSFLIYLKARSLSIANQRYAHTAHQQSSRNLGTSLHSRRSHATSGGRSSGGPIRRMSFVVDRAAAARDKNTRQVILQSFLYVGGYCTVYVWVLVLNIAYLIDPFHWGPSSSDYLPAAIVRLLFGLFYPLGGLYNATVFFRPRYLKWRNKNKNRSRFFALRMAISLAAPVKVRISNGGAMPEERPRVRAASRFSIGTWATKSSGGDDYDTTGVVLSGIDVVSHIDAVSQIDAISQIDSHCDDEMYLARPRRVPSRVPSRVIPDHVRVGSWEEDEEKHDDNDEHVVPDYDIPLCPLSPATITHDAPDYEDPLSSDTVEDVSEDLKGSVA